MYTVHLRYFAYCTHAYFFVLRKLQIECGIIVGAVWNCCLNKGEGGEEQIESWPKVNYYLCLAHVTQNTFSGNGRRIDGCGAICGELILFGKRLPHNIMQQKANFSAPW